MPVAERSSVAPEATETVAAGENAATVPEPAAKGTGAPLLKADHAAALEEKENQISALEQEKADLTEKIINQEQDITAKEETIGNLQADLDGAKASLETANATIAERDQALTERDQQIQDLNAEIDELKNDGGAEPQAGASPANNGAGVDEPKVEVGRYAYDNNLSYEENMRRKREFEKK